MHGKIKGSILGMLEVELLTLRSGSDGTNHGKENEFSGDKFNWPLNVTSFNKQIIFDFNKFDFNLQQASIFIQIYFLEL